MSPPSSRTVDPRLAAASGVMRDTVGAIHNLQHLLGSVRVGPKALARVIPDVHASCGPMILAVQELSDGARDRLPGVDSAIALGELVTRRMREVEKALASARNSAFRASDRLQLETAIAQAVRDLDGALDLVELMVEASASGSVPVDVTDVIRESAARPDSGAGRRKVRVIFETPSVPISVRVNPRLALRIVAFGVALAASRDAGVRVGIAADGATCRLGFSPEPVESGGLVVVLPPLIELTEGCVGEVARAAGAALSRAPGERAPAVSFPVAAAE